MPKDAARREDHKENDDFVEDVHRQALWVWCRPTTLLPLNGWGRHLLRSKMSSKENWAPSLPPKDKGMHMDLLDEEI